MAWWLLLVLYILQTVLLLLLALRQVRRPVYALAWVAIGLCLPVIGLILYAILTSRLPLENVETPARALETPDSLSDAGARVARAVSSITGTSPVPARQRVFHNGLAAYEALLEALASARSRIDMEFYIVRYDHIGQQIVAQLCERAAAGVRVRFLRDGLGSRKFPRHVLHTMRAHGIDCRTFFPFTFPWLTAKLNHRDHCKIVTIDGDTAFAGGINVGDEYTGLKPGIGPWRDTHLQISGREAVNQLGKVFERNWALATPDFRPEKEGRSESATTHSATDVRRIANMQSMVEWGEELRPDHSGHNASPWSESLTQTVDSRPTLPVETIRNLFFTCITQARQCVDITTPYFVPDTDLMTALKTAVTMGVQVRLIIPRQPDHKLVGYASRTFYKELLDGGVEVYLYQGAILHAKVMTVDGALSVIGAANYDLRSLRLNFEVSQVFYGEQLAHELQAQFERDLTKCKRLSYDMLQSDIAKEAGRERLARLFAPLL